jgi:uncharacterized protein
MDAPIDLAQFLRIATEKFSQNTRFRSWLRKKNPIEIAPVIENAYKQAATKTDCTQCGNCCSSLTLVPNSKDIKRLSDGLALDPFDFRQKYLKKDHEGDLVFKQRPCPFLKEKKCTVYESRPETCRSYPHMEAKHMSGRGWYIVENTLVCPIVFQTYETLKQHYGYKDLPEIEL